MAPQKVVQQMMEAETVVDVLPMMLFALFTAPFWEETVFRGFLQPFFRRYLGGAGTIAVVAVLFSLIHEPGSRFLRVPIVIFPLALALGCAYHRTQRLAAPLMLHVLHNLVTVTILIAVRMALW